MTAVASDDYPHSRVTIAVTPTAMPPVTAMVAAFPTIVVMMTAVPAVMMPAAVSAVDAHD